MTNVVISTFDIYAPYTIYDFGTEWCGRNAYEDFSKFISDLSKVLRVVSDSNGKPIYLLKIDDPNYIKQTEHAYELPVELYNGERLDWDQLFNSLLLTPLYCNRGFIFQPYSIAGDDSSSDYFNRFRGFRAKRLDKYDQNIVEPFFEHLRSLLMDDDEWLHWMISWFSWIVKHPKQKIRKIVYFAAPQGVGKNILLNAFIDHVIGWYHGMHVPNASRISREHNSLVARKIIIVIDSIYDDDAKSNCMKLKEITGMKTSNSSYTLGTRNIPDYCNYIISDTVVHPGFHHELRDTTIIVPPLTSIIKDDDYFTDLASKFKVSGFGDHLYTALLAYNGVDMHDDSAIPL